MRNSLSRDFFCPKSASFTGTVSNIDLHAGIEIKYELDLHVNVYSNCWFLFVVFLQCKWLRNSWFSETMNKFTEKNTFPSQKTTLSCTFLIRLEVQGYRCKSSIALFKESLKITLTVPTGILQKSSRPLPITSQKINLKKQVL